MTTPRSDRGAAALEFALLTPMFLAIVLGAVEFGTRYSEASQYNNAALVGARSVAVRADEPAARAAAQAANIRSGSSVSFSYTRGSCKIQDDGTYGDVTVTVFKTDIPSVTSLPNFVPGLAKTWGVSGKAVYRCGG